MAHTVRALPLRKRCNSASAFLLWCLQHFSFRYIFLPLLPLPLDKKNLFVVVEVKLTVTVHHARDERISPASCRRPRIVSLIASSNFCGWKNNIANSNEDQLVLGNDERQTDDDVTVSTALTVLYCCTRALRNCKDAKDFL